jgi:hypothetical protein
MVAKLIGSYELGKKGREKRNINFLCSAWKGYNSSKACMIVATSQSTVQWLTMG